MILKNKRVIEILSYAIPCSILAYRNSSKLNVTNLLKLFEQKKIYSDKKKSYSGGWFYFSFTLFKLS